ncbi:MAG: SUMF1/EgtB/PvdO family nonheme iron enzyme, partial [Bradymonadaceae bacterium]
MSQTTPGNPHPVAVEAVADDISPYEVRGLGGNVADWCLDGFEQSVEIDDGRPPDLDAIDTDADIRVVRGGHWRAGRNEC